MTEKGQLSADATRGIYHVEGVIDLPFQIVITGELEGPEYAAYRALTDHASASDVEQIIRDGGRETDSAMQDHYRVFLDLVAKKNPGVFEEIRRDRAMSAVWMDIFKDEINEREQKVRQDARQDAWQDAMVSAIRNVMESFGVSEERAMESLKIPQNQRATYAGLVKRV